MPEAAFHHRATLKQQHKPFKSKHASKGTLKDRAKGRAIRESPKSSPHSSATAAQKRLNRKNASKQAQLNKRHALVSAARIFNGVDGAPRIVAVVPLCEDVSGKAAVASLVRSLGFQDQDIPEQGVWRFRVDRFKTSLQFIILPYGSFYATLDAVRVADYTLMLLSSSVEVNAWGDNLLRTLQAQGIPSTITALAPSSAEDVLSQKDQTAIQKSLLSFIQYFIPSQSRVHSLREESNVSEALSAMRSLCEGKPADVRWREGRSYLLAEHIVWKPDGDEGRGTLLVTGVVRGGKLSPNRLIHIPDHGDFQVSKIEDAALPRSKSARDPQSIMDTESCPTTLLERNEADADSLVSTNEPNDMANEQTWPTEEEMAESPNVNAEMDIPEAAMGTTPKAVKRVPKGTSEYQAAWIIDDEGEEEDAEGTDDGEDEDVEIDTPSQDPRDDISLVEDEEEMEEVTRNSDRGGKHVAFEDLDMREESRQLETWRNRSREEAEDASFPDEMDTPQDVPARTRFQRFRGLRSFRTSPWDPFENLPRDYARIFQFEDFKRTERSILGRARENELVISPGTRVTIHILDVPSVVYEASQNAVPFVLFSLFKHEHKVSVQNYKIIRDTEYQEPVRSKDPLILCVGPRRLKTHPIYSQHTRGGGKGVNNVHKFERFLRHGAAHVASIFGPVTFGSQSCMLLKESKDREFPQLVATGSFLNPDTTRIIAKRIILTGHPLKVHKRTATVRYMFFNPEDVTYFAPVQLHTKHGRTGHIRESLGTHGYFKAHFDGPITQMDTVCLSLYKRVYPRWAELWRGTREAPATMATVYDPMVE